MDTLSMKELNMSRNGDYSFIGPLRQTIKSFVLNTILCSNDSPMRRHELAMDFANGFGLFMISQFSSERRDVVRSLTLTHFRHHTPLLIDIILDSNNDHLFESKLVHWIQSVYPSWIYKLSLKYNNRLEGVKDLFVRLIMNSMQYLNRNNQRNNKNIKVLPQFVAFFVDKAKKYHLQQMQKQHASDNIQSGGGATATNNNSASDNSASSAFSINRRNNSNEQWVMNVDQAQRNRWLQTIRCDKKRMKQCLADMKYHKFSDSYLPPTNNEEKKQKK